MFGPVVHAKKRTADDELRSFCRFAFAVLASNQLVAVANIVKFRYDDGITSLNWKTGEDIDHAVWFSAFFVCVVIVNMFPVRVWINL